MKLVLLKSTDPTVNLAAEEYLFFHSEEPTLLLWQNNNAVIIGKNQNTLSEINMDRIRKNGVSVVRRITGGGAVYHDMGNVNYSVIQKSRENGSLDFQFFTEPILKALEGLGLEATFSGRNDILIDGKKISGNAQYSFNGKTLHHGTLLFDSNLEMLEQLLTVDPEKIKTKAISSVRARVTNIKEHLSDKNMTVDGFISYLKAYFTENGFTESRITEDEQKEIEKLTVEKYRTWEWNYGYSPKYSFRKKIRTAAGSIEIFLDIDSGTIKKAVIFGDFFALNPIYLLEELLVGIKHEQEEIAAFFEKNNISQKFINISKEEFIELFR